MQFSKQQTQLIFERLLSGQFSVMDGGSRCHSVYYVKDGQWFSEVFDEGAIDTYPVSESSVRKLCKDKPHRFLHILLNPLWRRLGEAFEQEDWGVMQSLLDELEPYCASNDDYKMWSCVMAAYHGVSLEDARLEWLVSAMRSYNAYHAFCKAMGAEKTPRLGRHGERWMQLLFELVGDEVPYGSLQWGYFLAIKGDTERARSVFLARLEVLDVGPERELIERELDRLEETA